MAKVKLRKKPLSPSAQVEFLKREAIKQIGPFNEARAREYAAPTVSWQEQHKPDFGTTVGFSKNQNIFIRVFIRNSRKVFNRYGTTIGQLWRFWNDGTKPHIIRPRFAKVLRFVARGGNVVYTTLVRHPGTQGSGHKERVDRRLKPAERRAIDRALRVAFKRLERRNRN